MIRRHTHKTDCEPPPCSKDPLDPCQHPNKIEARISWFDRRPCFVIYIVL